MSERQLDKPQRECPHGRTNCRPELCHGCFDTSPDLLSGKPEFYSSPSASATPITHTLWKLAGDERLTSEERDACGQAMAAITIASSPSHVAPLGRSIDWKGAKVLDLGEIPEICSACGRSFPHTQEECAEPVAPPANVGEQEGCGLQGEKGFVPAADQGQPASSAPSSTAASKSRRQIVFDWLMQDEGYWGGAEEVARVDDLLSKLDAAAPSATEPRLLGQGELLEIANQVGSVSYSPPPMRAVRGRSFTFEQLGEFADKVIRASAESGAPK